MIYENEDDYTEKQTEKFKIGEDEQGNDITVNLPQCCVEGWPDCPHIINKPQRGKKSNIAL